MSWIHFLANRSKTFPTNLIFSDTMSIVAKIHWFEFEFFCIFVLFQLFWSIWQPFENSKINNSFLNLKQCWSKVLKRFFCTVVSPHLLNSFAFEVSTANQFATFISTSKIQISLADRNHHSDKMRRPTNYSLNGKIHTATKLYFLFPGGVIVQFFISAFYSNSFPWVM